MEKNIKKLCTALFASAALLACSREVRPDVPESPQGPETITITINASNDTESRTAIGENGASLWTAGDKLLVTEEFSTDISYQSQRDFTYEAESSPLLEGGSTALFSVSFRNYQNVLHDPVVIEYDHLNDFEGHPGMKFRFQAFYPRANAGTWLLSYPYMHLPDEQSPLADSFDPDADLLYSRPVYSPDQPSTLNLSFRRYSALGIMTLAGVPAGVGEDAIVTSVQFISGITGHENDPGPLNAPRTRSDYDDIDFWECPPLAGYVYLNSRVFAPEAADYILTEGLTHIIQMDYSDKALPAKNLDAYFTCLPATFVDGTCFTVVVSVDDNGQPKTYSRTVFLNGRELEFSSGVATTFSVDMTQAVLMREPTLNDFVTFDERTLAYFPELASDNPEIRIPFSNVYNNVAYDGIPISLTPNEGVSLIDYFIDDKYDEWEDLLWLEYFGYKDPEGYYLRYDSDYSDPDNPLSTSMVFELDVNGTFMSFRVPVSEYEYGFTFPTVTLFLGESADDLVEVEPYAVEDFYVGKSVTLHAVIDSKPGDLTPRVCYWTNDVDYDWNLDGDIPVPVHSGEWTILSLEASSDQRSVVVTGIDEGFDCANFIMIFDDIWFPESWNWVNFVVAPYAPPFYGDNDAAGGDMGGGKVINL